VKLQTRITFSKLAEKQINKLPKYIKEALIYWIDSVEQYGLFEIRKCLAYHDEPLKGARLNQRSVRLNKAYRAIYIELNGHLEIQLIEVNKHDY
jgi:proteic killer suppression protein